MAEGLGGHQSETILLANVFKLNCCCHNLLIIDVYCGYAAFVAIDNYNLDNYI